MRFTRCFESGRIEAGSFWEMVRAAAAFYEKIAKFHGGENCIMRMP